MNGRVVVVLVVLGLIVSCATIPKDQAYIGRWWGEEDGVTGTVELNSDHTCTFTIQGLPGPGRGSWTATDGNLHVIIRGDTYDGEYVAGEDFYGSLSADGDELSFWEEGSDVIILKKLD